MATLYHCPTFHSLFSRKYIYSLDIPSQNSRIYNHNHSGIVASSLKKPSPRKSRKVKSNEELCRDITEFLSAVGLPENYVPSMKEFSQYGRQDLANIVRRRGYKLIRQLLQTSISGNTDTYQTEMEVHSGSEGQNVKSNHLPGDVLPNEAFQEVDVDGCTDSDEQLNLDDQSSSASKSITLSLQEKVAKFLQLGELDTVEDSGFGVKYDRHANQAERKIELKDAHKPDFAFSHQLPKDLPTSSSTDETFNGSVPSSVQRVKDAALESSSSRNSHTQTEVQVINDCKKDTTIENKQNVESQAEIKHLKFLLHQKELELIQLKQQIEEQKLALSILQTKAETEIKKAEKLIFEKETELRAAEESLSGLKEVEIQYSGDGEKVELAGSFNGWHHKIKMYLASSFIMDHTGPRTSRLWRAVLWLYPGVYEIKFVIDGHWRIDPLRESVARDGIHNNILRVDR